MLQSPMGEQIEQAVWLDFSMSNNEAILFLVFTSGFDLSFFFPFSFYSGDSRT